MPILTALSNDICYEDVFAELLKNKGQIGDILICISGSGNSENVIRAAKMAKHLNMTTIGLVGYDGGNLKDMVDYCIHVNINDMQITEDVHMILDHVITKAICEKEP